MKTIEFFVPMKKVPTTTHQQKQINVQLTAKKGKPIFYEPDDVAKARAKYMANLAQYAPETRFKGPLRLIIKWCFKCGKSHKNGEYKTTKPDLDNSNKLLQDCMTDLGFWQDDAHIASLIAEKFWSDVPGIYIKLEEIV